MSELTVGKRLQHRMSHRDHCHPRAAPMHGAELRGAPMGAAEAARSATSAGGADRGVVLGKRYVDEQTGLAVLCTKAGARPLVAEGRQLVIKAAKALPASD